jgi:hypothetical protein
MHFDRTSRIDRSLTLRAGSHESSISGPRDHRHANAAIGLSSTGYAQLRRGAITVQSQEKQYLQNESIADVVTPGNYEA